MCKQIVEVWPTSNYGWIITRDCLEDRAVRVIGPSNIDPRVEKRLDAGDGQQFRCLDGDGEIYFEGRIIGKHNGFEPLDDYAGPDSGCTDIEYLQEDGWNAL